MSPEYIKFFLDLKNISFIKEISGIAIPLSNYPYEPVIGLDICNFFNLILNI
jgi:hypothetical protein